jgi:hypothetical protein
MLHLTLAQAASIAAAAIFNCGLAAAAIAVVMHDRPRLRPLALKGQVIAARRAPSRFFGRVRQPRQASLRAATRAASR